MFRAFGPTFNGRTSSDFTTSFVVPKRNFAPGIAGGVRFGRASSRQDYVPALFQVARRMDRFLPKSASRTPARRSPLRLEQLEDRTVPSSSIQLSGLGWKPLGLGLVENTTTAVPGLTNAGRINMIAAAPVPFDPGNPGALAPTDPTDPNFELWNTYYAATPGGGVARTRDGGRNWQFLTDNLPAVSWLNVEQNRNLHIGAVAVSPFNRNLVLAGTGEAFGGTFGFAGRGLLRSTDGGDTWLLNKGPANAFDGNAFTKFVFHPTDANAIYAIVNGSNSTYGSGNPSAVYRSLDGGVNWVNITTNIFGGPSLGTVTDFILDPTSPNVGYVGVESFGVVRTQNLQNGPAYTPAASINFSLTLGGTGTQLAGGSFGQIRLAFGLGTPSQPSRIYAITTSPRPGLAATQLFRSDDSGINYRRLDPFPGTGGSTATGLSNQFGIYNLTLVADPTFPNRIYVGGRGTGSIQVLTNADYDPDNVTVTPNWVNLTIPPTPGDNYTTIRDIRFDNTGAKDVNGRPLNPGRLLVATDSGVYRLEAPNGANTTNANFLSNNLVFANLNGNVGTTALAAQQVFATGLPPRDDNRLIVSSYLNGTSIFQDNGPFAPGTANYAGLFGNEPIGGAESRGNGGNIVVNQLDPQRIYRATNPTAYATTQGGLFQRSIDGGQTFATSTGGLVNTGRLFPQVPLEVNPSPQVGTLAADMVLGTDVVNRSSDDGVSWSQYWSNIRFVTATPSFTVISALAVGRLPLPFNPSYPLYVASNARRGVNTLEGPAIYRATLGPNGEQWWLDISPGNLGGPFVVDTLPGTEPTPNDLSYLLGRGGYISDIAVDPTDSRILTFTGDSTGLTDPMTGTPGTRRIYRSTDSGNTWTDISGNLPATLGGGQGLRVYSIALDPNRLNLQPGDLSSPTFQEDDQLYIGTSTGVYRLTNPISSTTWVRIGGTGGGVSSTGTDIVQGALPDVMVRDVKLNTTTGVLSAATFGRGVWQLQIRPYIRGLVFDDTTGNGVFDATDGKAAGTVVVANDIIPNPDIQFANTTTNVNGEYVFRSLPDSTYSFIPSDASTTLIDTFTRLYFTSNPIVQVMDESKTINGQDLWVFRRVSINGFAYEDANGDGDFDTGENPAIGYVVSLLAPAGTLNPTATLVATATTDANGNYTFLGVGPLRPDAVGPSTPFTAGYQVAINKTGFQMSQTPDKTGALMSGKNLTDAANAPTTRVGVFRFGQVGGVVFSDSNGDGALNGGEVGASGWTVEIRDAGTGALVDSKVTGASGAYQFGDLISTLKAGSYNISVLDKTGFIQTTGTLPTNPVISGTSINGINIGVFAAAGIGGFAFEDFNGNGVQDGGENTPITGASVGLFDPRTNTLLGTTTTDGAGNYLFSGLFPLQLPGNTVSYAIRLAGPLATLAQTNADPTAVLTSGATAAGRNLALFQRTTVAGFAFEDFNGDGIQNNGEGGLAGGSVSLLDSANGSVAFTTITDGNGNFLFTGVGPIPGPVAFRVGANPIGFVQTTPNPPDFVVFSNTPVSGFSIGLFRQATFSGFAFDDFNGNGALDSGELGLAGRSVELVNLGTGAVVATGNTDGDGNYALPAGVGSFAPRLVPQPGFVQTTPILTGTSTTSGLNVPGGNFGSFQLTTITGRVFNDINGNSLLDANEPGLPGVRIDLVNAATGAVVGAADTDGTGFFSINGVGPGNFRVREILPTNFIASTPTVQAFSSFSGTPSNFSFGNFLPSVVGGNIFEDLDRTTSFTAGDINSPGWTVRLLRPGGIVLQTVTSNASGNYSFAGVVPGSYTVQLVARTGFTIFTGNNQTATTISGSTITLNRIPVLKLASITGSIFLDSNRSGTKQAFERGLADGVVGAFDGNGTQVATQTTDATGVYTFFGLNSGTFTVRLLSSPSGFQATNNVTARSVTVATGSPSANNVGVADFGVVGRKRYALAADGGGGPRVQIYDALTGTQIRDFFVYEVEFTGGVRVANADVNGDGVEDLIVVPGVGGGPRVRVLDGVTGGEVYNYFAYEPTFVNGLYVTAADVNGDGFADIITGTAPGGGPRVTIFSGRDGRIIGDYFAYSSDFRGGVRVGSGDVDGDGLAEIITAPGQGFSSEIRIWNTAGMTAVNAPRVQSSFFAFDPSYTGGVYIAGATPNLDGRADVIVSTGIAFPSAPVIRTFDGQSLALKSENEAFPSGVSVEQYTSEVRAASFDRNGDGTPDLAIVSGPGSIPRFRIIDGRNFRQIGDETQPYEAAFLGGIFIG